MALNVRSAVIAWCVVAFLTWIVALAGMSAITHDCRNNFAAADCTRGLQYEWWGVWFEFILIMLTLAIAAMTILEGHYLTLLIFFAICTSILTWSARSVMVLGSYAEQVTNRSAAKNTAAAGFILLCIANYLLIIMLGSAGRLHNNYFEEPIVRGNQNANGQAAAAAAAAPAGAGTKYIPPGVDNLHPVAINAHGGAPGTMHTAPGATVLPMHGVNAV